MRVVIGSTEITNYIVEGSYDVNSSDSYESWQDGNMVEHRIIVSEKVSGKFNVACSNQARSITLANFLTLWNANVDNGVISLSLYVNNTDEFKAIEAYYKITNKEHTRTADGSFVDVLNIEIKER